MKNHFISCTLGILSFFFIPYFFIIPLNGIDTLTINQKFNVERILPVITATQIDKNMKLETIKAQTIIARSDYYRRLEEKESLLDILKGLRRDLEKKSFSEWILDEKYERAVEETRGEVLVRNYKLELLPYHQLSAGRTRNGKEVLHSDKYKYLKSVKCDRDKEADDYLSSFYISQVDLPKNLIVKKRDSVGYVTEIRADDMVLEGETFSRELGLASSNFSIKRNKNNICFLCKGKGHGLGFSQYGGDQLAKNKKTAEEILTTYFADMQIVNVREIK